MLFLATMKNAAFILKRKNKNNKRMYRPSIATAVSCIALLISPSVQSEDEWQALPPPAMTSDASTPEVVITPREDRRIREYRINGVLYMIEVTPKKGPPYILVDMDGDGSMETRRQAFDGDEMMVPRWTLLRW